MKRSLTSAASVLKEEAKGDKSKKSDKENLDTPLVCLLSLEKEVSRLRGDVSSMKGKVDRAEKHEKGDVDELEQAVAEIQARVDKVQMETASARANPESREGKAREVKKKKKFLVRLYRYYLIE